MAGYNWDRATPQVASSEFARAFTPLRVTDGVTPNDPTKDALKQVSIASLIAAATTESAKASQTFSQSTAFLDGTLGKRGQLFISAKDDPFNAKGDGSTDDTAAINAALAAALSRKVPLYFPAGRYKYAGQLTVDLASVLTSGLKIYGDGAQRSIIDFGTQTTGPLFLMQSTGGDCFYPELLDIGFVGNVPGAVAQFGATDFSGAINKPTMRVAVGNLNTTSAAVGAILNHVLNADINIETNCGLVSGSVGAGKSLICRQLIMSRVHGSCSTADTGISLEDGYSYGNDFTAMDVENVRLCVSQTSSHSDYNTFRSGNYVYSGFGAESTGPGVMLFDNVTANPQGGASAFINPAKATGIVFRDARMNNVPSGIVSYVKSQFIAHSVNVIDFAAPGQTVGDGSDWTAAFTAALATGANVRVPAGTFDVRSTLLVQFPGQRIIGAGAASSVLRVTYKNSSGAFTATSWLDLTKPVILIQSQRDGSGAVTVEVSETLAGVDDLGITFVHGSTSTRSALTAYSWAIKVDRVTRPFIGNVRINGGMNGIGLGLGSNGGAGALGGRWEIGCYGTGLSIDSTLDTIHVDTIRFWPYGCSNLGIYLDGSTIGATLGSCDGFHFDCLMTLGPKINFVAGSRADGTTAYGPFGTIGALHLDTAIDTLTFQAGQVQIGSGYISLGPQATYGNRYAVHVEAAVPGSCLKWSSGWLNLSPDMTVTPISVVTDGCLMMDNWHVRGAPATACTLFSISGGQAFLSNWNIDQGGNTTRTAPWFDVSGGFVSFRALRMPGVGTGSGIGLRVTANNSHDIEWTMPGGWSVQLPPDPLNGSYRVGTVSVNQAVTINRV